MSITACSPSGRLRVLSTFSTCLNASQATTRDRGRRSTQVAPGLAAKCIWRTPVAQRLPRMPRHEVWEGPPSLPPYQAAAVAHVAAHDLGAAAYAIRAAQSASASDRAELERLSERDWQREQLPAAIRLLVLEDQRQRNSICWHVFDD
jgi:hypothetical protein